VTPASKTAVVTGAASGIGNAVLHLLLARHVGVIAVDVDQDALDDLAGTPAVKTIAVDLADAKQRDSLSEEAGEVDYLVNCAGLIRLAPIASFDLESWRQIFAVNAEAVFFLTQALMPSIRDGGAIVNVSSAAAKLGTATESAAYAASKAAVLSITRSFAHELAPRHIRVNAVCPGLVNTAMQEEVIAGKLQLFGGDRAGLSQKRLEAVPLARVASPSEIAETICFLLSDGASYMTGEAINVSGGMVTW
jgi:NAD(P)-dependent dehydrogenase (short-subunit alcohol dehydrogenase family)